MTTSRERRRLNVVEAKPFPAYVVWELTLALRSRVHALWLARGRGARSRAVDGRSARRGRPARRDGCPRGRADRRRGVPARRLPRRSSRALRERGIAPALTTGGRGITAELAARAGARGPRVCLGLDRRARSDARSHAQSARQLALGDGGARSPARCRHRHRVEHQSQPAQPSRSRAAVRRAPRTRHRVVAGTDHVTARSRRGSHGDAVATVGSARRRAARRRAQEACSRRRDRADAGQQPRLLRSGGDRRCGRSIRPIAITGKAARRGGS